MIKLYGFPISNYYNMVKMALLEKDMEFQEVAVRPTQEGEFLGRSPMGKVPCIETPQGFLTETRVILDYIEEVGSGPSFYPVDPFARAKVREIMAYLELYIELPARRLYGDVFFGRPASQGQKDSVRADLEKGFAALHRLARFEPYIAGSELSYADFFFYFSTGLACRVTKKALDWDAYNEIHGLRNLMTNLADRPSIRRILADQQAAAA